MLDEATSVTFQVGKVPMNRVTGLLFATLSAFLTASQQGIAEVLGGKTDLFAETVKEYLTGVDQEAPPVEVSVARFPASFHIEAASAFADRGLWSDDEWSYTPNDFAKNLASIPWETTAVVGGTLALGFSDWDWGSAKFHFNNEGFFGKDTSNGGMDKLGHAYGTSLLADFFTSRLERRDVDSVSAALTGSIMALGVMGMVETFDGFSTDYGFSPQDIVANTAGATFAFLRNTVPGMKEKLDFRLEYVPSGYDRGFAPHSDYAGQKYVLALKLSGFEKFEDSPLRFFEIQTGYFTEGFKFKEARERGISRSRHPYVGIGINLEQVLLGHANDTEPTATYLARSTLQRVQVPFTYISSDPHAYHY